MGGDANIARDEVAARGLTEEPATAFVRIPLSERGVAGKPLNGLDRFLIACNGSAVGRLGARTVRRLAPSSRIRRSLFRVALGLGMKACLAGDRRALSTFYEPDAEIIVPPWPGLDERYVGADGFMDFFDAWTDSWDHVELELRELIDLGEATVVLGWMHTRGGASGVATKQPYSSYQDYNASRITRAEWFMSWEEGMAAAGLEGGPLPD